MIWMLDAYIKNAFHHYITDETLSTDAYNDSKGLLLQSTAGNDDIKMEWMFRNRQLSEYSIFRFLRKNIFSFRPFASGMETE